MENLETSERSPFQYPERKRGSLERNNSVTRPHTSGTQISLLLPQIQGESCSQGNTQVEHTSVPDSPRLQEHIAMDEYEIDDEYYTNEQVVLLSDIMSCQRKNDGNKTVKSERLPSRFLVGNDGNSNLQTIESSTSNPISVPPGILSGILDKYEIPDIIRERISKY